jgi:hypothetical protein
MTDHFLRLKWIPADEAGLLQAYRGGLLAERNWCDLKKALDSGKGANPNWPATWHRLRSMAALSSSDWMNASRTTLRSRPWCWPM